MTDESEKSKSKNNISLINVKINDIFGLKSAYPALTKSIDNLVEAITQGTGHILEPAREAIAARVKRYEFTQKTRSNIDILDLYIEKGAQLGVQFDNKMFERLLSRMLLEDLEKQQIRENIASKSMDEFTAIAHGSKVSEDPPSIDKDWLSLFWECAEKKTNAELQDIFAKILSREALSPGSIDPATLHVLSIMSAKQARMIQRILSIAIYIESESDYFVVEAPLGEGAQIEAAPDWFDFGISDMDYLAVEEMGIMARVISVLFDDIEDVMDIQIGSQKGKLFVKDREKAQEIACKPLTQIALNLRNVIPLLDNEPYVRDLTRFFDEYGFSMEMENINESH